MTALIADGLPFTAHDDVMSRKDLRAAVHDGRVRRVLRGVYVDARVEDTRELRIGAVDRVRPAFGVACSETAAWLMGVNTFPPGRRHDFTPSFLVPHGATKITRSGIHARQAELGPRSITDDFGVLSTTPIRTAADLLRRQYRPYALASTDQLTRTGLIDLGELADYVSYLKGYPGIRQARSLVALVDGRSESHGESWTRLRLHDAGFPIPELQVRVIDTEGAERRIDLAYVEQRIAIEYDGREHHTADVDVVWDATRRAGLSRQHGWRWVIADRDALFGLDMNFEETVGELLGMSPIRRWWGTRVRHTTTSV